MRISPSFKQSTEDFLVLDVIRRTTKDLVVKIIAARGIY